MMHIEVVIEDENWEELKRLLGEEHALQVIDILTTKYCNLCKMPECGHEGCTNWANDYDCFHFCVVEDLEAMQQED